MNTSELYQIKATGYMLAFYHSDLNYINEFQRFKNGLIPLNDYLTHNSGTFQSFLNEFRISRNSNVNRRTELLRETHDWIISDSADDVDKFAQRLKDQECTHNFLAISMASKILFLNNPAIILPSDVNVRKALGVKGKSYQEYADAASNYKKVQETDIYSVIQLYDNQLSHIENMFPEIYNIAQVRINRYVDKLLWVRGME